MDEVTLLAGHGGSGKSLVALLLAVCVALGLPLAGLATKQASVLFYSAEDGARVLQKRLHRVCRALKVDVNDLKGKLHLLDVSDLDPALHREQRRHLDTAVFETRMLADLADLATRLELAWSSSTTRATPTMTRRSSGPRSALSFAR